MTISQYMKNTYQLSSDASPAIKIPCAEDRKSFLYFSEPYKGVCCWANDIHSSTIPAISEDFHCISFNFCTAGSCEVSLNNGNFVYVTKELLCIATDTAKGSPRYPTSSYSGLEIIIDFSEQETRGLPALFGLDFAALAEAVTREGGRRMVSPCEDWKQKAANLAARLSAQNISIEEIRFFLLELLFHLLHNPANMQEAAGTPLTKGQRKIASEVGQLVSENLEKRFTVEELSAKYRVSPSSLKKYFTQLYGMPFSEYLRQLRMEHAAKLIATDALSIGEIAERTGYQNQSKFGSAFKIYFGIPPLEYRRLHAGK